MKATMDESGIADDPREQIIDALRSEIEEYGGLLNRFDEQQNAILARDPEAVLAADGDISAQLTAVRERRKCREALVSELAVLGVLSPKSSLKDVTPLFREPMRPLVQALISEVNRLITLARRRARQNQMLLARTIEVTQELLALINPGAVTRTYSPQGRMKIKAPAGSGRLLEKS